MTRNSVAASVAQSKERHPENYCPVKRCLWRTGGGYCPRHSAIAKVERSELCAGFMPADAEFSASEVLAIQRGIEREDENVNKSDRG